MTWAISLYNFIIQRILSAMGHVHKHYRPVAEA
jgi:hypothetical protein